MRDCDIFPYQATFLILCEGTITEPLFFSEIEKLQRGLAFKVYPKPPLKSVDVETHSNRGGKRRKTRQVSEGTRPVEPEDDVNLTGGKSPLYLVEEGKNHLDTFEEVWCVFDKDNHTTCKEAFKKAEEIQNANTHPSEMHIGFSSRCIEYYFLLHFEYIYKAFQNCDCKGKIGKKKVLYRCVTPDAIKGKACIGDLCINGYARSKKYWDESKTDDSGLFKDLIGRLNKGFGNAELLRRESDRTEPQAKICERNPYVNVDQLVIKLLGYSNITHGEIKTFKEGPTILEVKREKDAVIVKNIGDAAFSTHQVEMWHFNLQNNAIHQESVPGAILTPETQDDNVILNLLGPEGDITFIKFINCEILCVK